MSAGYYPQGRDPNQLDIRRSGDPPFPRVPLPEIGPTQVVSEGDQNAFWRVLWNKLLSDMQRGAASRSRQFGINNPDVGTQRPFPELMDAIFGDMQEARDARLAAFAMDPALHANATPTPDSSGNVAPATATPTSHPGPSLAPTPIPTGMPQIDPDRQDLASAPDYEVISQLLMALLNNRGR